MKRPRTTHIIYLLSLMSVRVSADERPKYPEIICEKDVMVPMRDSVRLATDIYRPAVVVYQTDPLTEDIEVIGPIEVVLHASSNRLDTDFTAKLIDVYPPSADFPSGFEMNLTDGILRARYRNSPEKQELMRPGTIYRFSIQPFGTANVFKKGHRIRVDISSSNFPRFDVNPNTGEPLGLNQRMVTADFGPERREAESVHLPIEGSDERAKSPHELVAVCPRVRRRRVRGFIARINPWRDDCRFIRGLVRERHPRAEPLVLRLLRRAG